MYRVFQRKKLHKVYAPQFCNRTSQSHAVFSKMFRKNSLHDKGQCLNTDIKYSFLQLASGVFENKINKNFKGTFVVYTVNKVSAKPAFQN